MIDRLLQWFEELRAAWKRGRADNIQIIAAGMAHYALMALVPAMVALVLSYGLFVSPDTVASHISLLSQHLPGAAAELIGQQMREVSQGADQAKGVGLAISLAIALFGARNGARSLMVGLNVAFHAEQTRSYVWENIVAIGVTLVGLSALGLVAGISAFLASVPNILGTIAGAVFLSLAAGGGAAVLYRYAPNMAPPNWRAVRRGAIFFAICWIFVTAGFTFYAANFARYNATYGSLGAVIVLITWFFASGFFLLLGAEIAALRNEADQFADDENVKDSQLSTSRAI